MKHSLKKKWKRILSMMLAVALVLGLWPTMPQVKADAPGISGTTVNVYKTTVSDADASAIAMPIELKDASGTTVSGLTTNWIYCNFVPQGEDSGLFKNGQRVSRNATGFKYAEANALVLYLEGFGGATPGDVFTVKGTFYYASNNETITFVKPQTYVYTESGYKEIGTTTVKTMSVTDKFWADNNSGIYTAFVGQDLSDLTVDWNNRFKPMDNESGVFVNGSSTPASLPANGGYAYQDGAGKGFYLESFGTLDVGGTVTIKGSFYSPSTGESIRLLNAVTFTWNGDTDKWTKTTDVFNDTDYARYSGSVTLEGAESGNNSSSKLYLKGDTGLDSYKSDNVLWSSQLTAKDGDENGIFFNDAKVSGGKGLFKYNDGSNYWCLDGSDETGNGFSATNSGDKITIKGDFIDKNANKIIHIDEVCFMWNGSQWKDVVYDDITFTGINTATGYVDGSGWFMYLNPSTALPGTENVTHFNGLKAQVGAGELFDIRVDKTSHENTAFTVINAEHATKEIAAGTKVTIKAGTAVADDGVSHGINLIEDFVMYALGDGDGFTTEVPPTYRQFSYDGINGATVYSDVSSFWNVYLHPSVEVPGTAWTTSFTGIQVQVGDEEAFGVTVQKTSHEGTTYFQIPSDKLPKDVVAGTKIVVKAGKANPNEGSEGIELTTDFIMYALGDGAGFTTEAPTTYTDIQLTGMNANTGLSGSSWSAYFPVSASLPGDAWGQVDAVPETYSVLLSVNGQEASTCTAKNAGGEGLFVEIPTSLLPQNEKATVVIKAGEYKNSLQNIGIRLTEDFTFYASKYGWSTKDTIWEVAAKPFFTKVVTDEAYSGAGITLNSNIDDGAEYDGGWEKKLYPVIKGLKYDKNGVTDTSTLYFDSGENGLWTGSGAEATFTGAKNMPLVKLGSTIYVAYIGDTGNKGETSGDTFIVGGLFHDENGRLIQFERIQVKWNGSDWEQEFLALDDTGVEADLNADGVTDSRDLVRMLRHQKNEVVSINTGKRDINNDEVFNASDVIALRKVLLGLLSYYGGTAEGSSVPYGTPVYSTKRVIEKMAYSCPAVGTWNEANTEFTPYADADIDTALQKYKAAGFTLLNSQFVAQFANMGIEDEKNKPLCVFLKAAQRNGLGVIVCSDYINTVLEQKDLANSDYKEWKNVIPSLVYQLSSYPAFKGFMMSDELSIQYADNYKAVTAFIHEKYPNLVLHSSQLSVTAYTVSGLGAESLTTDTATNNTKELAYKDYVKTFGIANGTYTFDMYPLIYSADKIFGSTIKSNYFVNSEWYDNLKWVSEVSKEQGFKTGVTIQSCKLAGTNSSWSTYERYAPTEKADIGFQIYTAMAYGMQEFNYFTYCDHPKDKTVEEAMNDNTQVYTAVKSINQEIDSFANVFKAFTWKDTLDIAAEATNESTGNARLQSAASNGGRAFVGCMKDSDGFDGYMVANAEGPRPGKTATVTLTFKSATKAMIYKGTSYDMVDLTDGVYNVSLDAGEGAFIIPIREKVN